MGAPGLDFETWDAKTQVDRSIYVTKPGYPILALFSCARVGGHEPIFSFVDFIRDQADGLEPKSLLIHLVLAHCQPTQDLVRTKQR